MVSRRQFLVASLALTSSFGVGCTASKEEKSAQRVLDHHFDMMKRRTFDAAMADYDDSFFSGVTRAEWRAALSAVADKLGAFQSYDVRSTGLAYKNVAGPGSYLRFQVEVTYSKHPSDETFYLFRRQGGSKFKIVGHQIDADGLNK